MIKDKMFRIQHAEKKTQKRWNDQLMILFCWIVNADIATEVCKTGSDAK